MGWFTRKKEGIVTDPKEKKEVKSGLWYKCPKCKVNTPTTDLVNALHVCECGFHERITAKSYFNILFDKGRCKELDSNLVSTDKLNFTDTKSYLERLKSTQKKTGLKDAILVATGKIDSMEVVIGAMDFRFIGGSMGSVVGEKIARAIDYCIDYRLPLILISKSGGARMMEAAFSLMQMAKTAAKLTQLSDAKIPYISLLTDPTTGGVTASFAMLGDINIAEPGALIGFAGPRVIKETIGKDLPEGFQTAEFLLEHGFIDYIVHRKELKDNISKILQMFAK